MVRLLIAIDGFSGSGKGELSRALSAHYGIDWLDTGKLYRVVGYEALRQGRFDDEFLRGVAASLSVDGLKSYDFTLLCDERVGTAASKISAIKEVREALLGVQRNFAYNHNADGAILDGRDIGTVVCPDANRKIFVCASPELRARRRFLELQGSPDVFYEEIYKMIVERDARDLNRQFAPLVPAEDAYILDTSELTISQMTQKAVNYVDMISCNGKGSPCLDG